MLSDHADWAGLLRAIEATGCETATLTHGFAAPLASHLRSIGLEADTVATRFGDDADSGEAIADAERERITIAAHDEDRLFDEGDVA